MHLLDRVSLAAAFAVGQHRRVLAQGPPVLVDLGFDPKPQQEQLDLTEQFETTAVQRHILRLRAVIGDRAIGREQTAENRGLAGAIELRKCGR